MSFLDKHQILRLGLYLDPVTDDFYKGIEVSEMTVIDLHYWIWIGSEITLESIDVTSVAHVTDDAAKLLGQDDILGGDRFNVGNSKSARGPVLLPNSCATMFASLVDS